MRMRIKFDLETFIVIMLAIFIIAKALGVL